MNYPLMTYKEYLKLAPFPNPYVYTIHSNGRYLYYLGVHHCFDPKNLIFKVIEHYWNDFLSFTHKQNVVTLVEGGLRFVEKPSPDEIILRDGEAGFTAYLAFKEGWNHSSPEPDRELEVQELLKNFSKDEILTYFFVRRASQWNRLIEKPEFESYVQKSLDRYKKELGWEDKLFSFSRRIEYLEKLSGRKFDGKNHNLMSSLSNPIELNTKINRVSRKSGEIRNRHIVDKIKNYWDQGKNIFLVYGSSHAIIQEKVLRKILR